MLMKEIEDQALLLGIDLSSIDLDSIHLPPGDNCGIPRYINQCFCTLIRTVILDFMILNCFFFPPCSDDDDVIQEENLEFDSGFGNIIVVDNLPVVPKEKFDKLVTVVRKIYSQIGAIKEDGLWMPVDPATEKSLGYCFIEYNTPQVNRYSFLGRIQCLFYHRFDEVKLQWLF